MAVKTFTSEILTSSDTNTYLANSGLVYVTSQTIGSGVASINVPSAFNSTYNAYKVIVAGGATSADAQLYLKLGASATGYYAIKAFYVYSTAGGFAGSDNNAAQWTTVGFSINGQGMSAAIELQNPFLAKYTYMSASAAATTIGGAVTGVHQVATSYTDLTITASAGTMTGGTVTVYGYRLG
jgi:hypothetical protein